MFSYMKQGKGFYQGLIALAVPMILQNLIVNAVGLIDTFMVGSLGEEAIAAVQTANLPVFVVQLVVFGLMSGSSVLIAQYWGKRDEENISRVIGIGWTVAGTVGILFAIVMAVFPEQLLGLLNNNPAVVKIGAEYARPIGISYFFTSIAGVFNGAQRSMENPKAGLINSSVSVVLNLFFNYALIYGNFGMPALGVRGAAIATLIARMGEFVVVLFYVFFSKRFRIRASVLFRPGKDLLARYLKYATPVVINETLWGLGFSMYQVVMGNMENSTEILAAYTISGNLEKMFAVFMFAIGNAAAVIIGKEIGAGRANQVYHKGLCLATLSSLVGAGLGVCIALATRFVFAPHLYGPGALFDISQGAAEIATMMLYMMAGQMFLRAFNNCCIVGVLRGGGAVRMSMLIDTIPLWLIAVPLTFLFGLKLHLSILAVYSVHWIENSIKAVWNFRKLRQGQWIHDVTVTAS